MIEEGDKISGLELPDQSGETRTLKDLSGKKGLVLYVYPKDDTPGCTVEAQDFRDRLEDFQAKGWNVAGISRDSAQSHCKFIDKYDLTFPLLTDADASFLEELGAYGEKTMYGRTTRGIIRSTFLIEADGTVRKAMRNVRAKGHADRVMKELD